MSDDIDNTNPSPSQSNRQDWYDELAVRPPSDKLIQSILDVAKKEVSEEYIGLGDFRKQYQSLEIDSISSTLSNSILDEAKQSTQQTTSIVKFGNSKNKQAKNIIHSKILQWNRHLSIAAGLVVAVFVSIHLLDFPVLENDTSLPKIEIRQENFSKVTKEKKNIAGEEFRKSDVMLERDYDVSRTKMKSESHLTRAIKSYQKLAAKGDAQAQFRLAQAYESSTGVKKNSRKAVYWYQLAAVAGYTQAQYKLATLYWYGKNLAQNYKFAFDWFNTAAKQGHALSYYYLGLAYRSGQGVAANPKQATLWLEKARQAKVSCANDILNKVALHKIILSEKVMDCKPKIQ